MNVLRVVQKTISFCCRKSYYNVQQAEELKFYLVPANVEEVHSGYLHKSPPHTLFKSLKSWKRRYFVLNKTPGNLYELKFFRDKNKRDKQLGQINLHEVLLLFQHAESHPICSWIQRNFKCSASCVLYMRVPEREYFLVGENSDEVEDWFNAMFKALKTLPKSEEFRKCRSISAPSGLYRDPQWFEDQEQNKTESVPSSLTTRQSAPESFNALYSHYDYPKNYMKTLSQPQESDDSDDDEEDEMKINQESEPEESISNYMDMICVTGIMRQAQNKEAFIPQTNVEGNNVLENSFLQTCNQDTGSTALSGQISPRSEMVIPVEKEIEIFVSQNELKYSVIFSEKGGRVCVSNWMQRQSSELFHEGDQILAINDLLTDSLVELKTYLKRLTKDQVKLTILRQPGSQPLTGCCT
ncbi:pleckstrin homology domain-containing family S member 1-like isoform X2 [Tachysurus vachellii]|uniref:pleckstrin homology domain-containing family S member 1-like isoform X2 n=1 Tax=Tachysurus vachellii TaxID=175792 RepID=UPI00296B336C|nr:pleckstrin homology domain-containing family S member 1-like isoform X2 [Tachysurus vachellii]XP_060714180.1 pleckstrin homology domain-containing family S member 1-like isoform X2 [Tachysurus vachellii]